MPPFRLEFLAKKSETLSELQRRRLENLTKNTLGGQIRKITFSMAKLLFEPFLNGGQYYHHPVNLYASLFDLVSNSEEIITKRQNLKELFKDGKEDIKGSKFLAGYIRFIDYLYLHGAGDPKHSQITVDLMHLVSQVIPSLCYHDKHGEVRRRNIDDVSKFVSIAATIVAQLDGLDYQISGPMEVIPGQTPKAVFKLTHPLGSMKHNA
ncbi:MAG: hypothetical protein Nk1A_4590 [Endomicrobiia bacterium]|nr:MAG: hypothetical protein Nk1A_4590 [Endomicrobiia bacterium]